MLVLFGWKGWYSYFLVVAMLTEIIHRPTQLLQFTGILTVGVGDALVSCYIGPCQAKVDDGDRRRS